MNAKIFCSDIEITQIDKAFNLGNYRREHPNIHSIKYKIYSRGKSKFIEFESTFNFGNFVFLMVDMFEENRKEAGVIKGFVNTLSSDVYTSHLADERVCIFLHDDLKSQLKKQGEAFLDVVDIVTESNKNYAFEIMDFQLYSSEKYSYFEELNWQSLDFTFIQEGEYLYNINLFGDEEFL